jgi:hypothetical protein
MERSDMKTQTDLIYRKGTDLMQKNSSQVPRKYEEIPLTTGIRLAEWGHEREEKALDFALGRVGGEAVDLPLRVTGGGSAVCLRGR